MGDIRKFSEEAARAQKVKQDKSNLCLALVENSQPVNNRRHFEAGDEVTLGEAGELVAVDGVAALPGMLPDQPCLVQQEQQEHGKGQHPGRKEKLG